MKVDFTKMEGTGNDFVVVDNRRYVFSQDRLSALAQQVCPRRTGIGADGLLVFDDADEEDADYRMRYVNRDGSIASMCGNGARCLAQYARHVVGLPGDELRFQSDAGAYRARVSGDPEASVQLYVDPPSRFETNVSFDEVQAEMEEAGLGPFHYIWPGVEHVVCFVDGLELLPVEELGRAVRYDSALGSAGANVNFVQQLPEGSLWVRTYEKGVEAETLACGTGALAAACVARALDIVEEWPVDIDMPGGRLTVGEKPANGETRGLYLEGPARVVFSGEVEVDGLTVPD